jgi:uncharacterized repeat protein (TIGR01451 family)
VTQADIDAGGVTNAATATGSGPDGATATSPPATAVVDTVVTPAVSLVKFAERSVVSHAGQRVTYTYVVTNSGDLSLTDIAVSDRAFSGTGTRPVVTCPTTTLIPGAQARCSGSYTLTQADIDAGRVTNTAVATGQAPGGTTVESDPSSAAVDAAAAPALTLGKAADPPVVSEPGQRVDYTFLVVNNGNVTLTGVEVRETQFSGSAAPSPISCPATTLAPGKEMTCTAHYAVTQADLDAGSVVNVAVARGTDPADDPVITRPSTAVVDAEAVSILFTVKSADPPSFTGAGQHLTFGVAVTNTGTVTLSHATVEDTNFTGTGQLTELTCPPGEPIAPGETLDCTAEYTTTREDVIAGHVDNAATVTGTPPLGVVPPTKKSPSIRVPFTGPAALALTKTARVVDANGNQYIDVGDRIHWTFVVTNVGPTTLTRIAVADSVAGPVRCPAARLAPGASMTCTATPSAVTATIVAAGHVTNVATATGRTAAGRQVTAPPASATVSFGLLTVTGTRLTRVVLTGALLVGVGALLVLATARRQRGVARKT